MTNNFVALFISGFLLRALIIVYSEWHDATCEELNEKSKKMKKKKIKFLSNIRTSIILYFRTRLGSFTRTGKVRTRDRPIAIPRFCKQCKKKKKIEKIIKIIASKTETKIA